jgi:hypothetical protein
MSLPTGASLDVPAGSVYNSLHSLIYTAYHPQSEGKCLGVSQDVFSKEKIIILKNYRNEMYICNCFEHLENRATSNDQTH